MFFSYVVNVCVKGVKGSIGSFINLIMELKKCCNHAFLVRPPESSDEPVELDRFEVRYLHTSYSVSHICGLLHSCYHYIYTVTHVLCFSI